MIAAVYSPRSIFISALRMRDLVYYGSNSKDLFKSSKAFKFSFLLLHVSALLEQITEFSFLLAGSRLIASVYFFSAYSNLWFFISSLPSYFSCSHFFALFKALRQRELSGSNLIPSTKNLLARWLSPLYNSIIPLRYHDSGLPRWARGIVFSKVRASAVAPVFVKL